MANKTLLDGVNEILRRTGDVAGDASLLTSLTDSARQVSIDIAKQVINEGIDEIYSIPGMSRPAQLKEATVTLLTATRAYSLATDLVRLHWPLIDKTNTGYIWRYAAGYEGLLLRDPQQDDTGLPTSGAIRPTDGKLFLNVAPPSADNGKVYTYQYDKDTGLSVLTDNVPFNDSVFRAMVPAWVQLYMRDRRGSFDAAIFKASFGRACALLSEEEPSESYSPRQVSTPTYPAV